MRHSLGVLLAVLFLLVAVIALVQLSRMVAYRHNVLSFHFGFLALCALTSLARFCSIVFLIADKNMPKALSYFCDDVPLWLQLTTYSFLILFLWSVVLSKRTARHTTVIVAVWLCFVIAILIYECVLFFNSTELNDDIWSVLYAVVYLVLSVAIFSLGLRVTLMIWHRAHASAPELQQRGWAEMLFFTIAVCTCFLSRGIFNAASAAGSVVLKYPPFSGTVFVCMFFWDILPILMVLIFFRRIPRPNSFSQRWIDANTPILPQRDFHAPEAPQLFDNPSRYDSDTEDPPTPNNITSATHPQTNTIPSTANPSPWYPRYADDGISPTLGNPLYDASIFLSQQQQPQPQPQPQQQQQQQTGKFVRPVVVAHHQAAGGEEINLLESVPPKRAK